MSISQILIGSVLCLLLSISFVASLYVWERLDPKLKRYSRDHPRVIKLRTISVLLVSLVTSCITFVYAGSLGIKAISVKSLSITFTQICILMLGPIVDQWSRVRSIPRLNLVFVRTVVIAPIFEELVFRQCFHQILIKSGYTDVSATFFSPLLFTLAHAHHHLGSATVSQVLSQILHTCIFGWLGGYLLVTRSLCDAILAHALCNYIGLPPNSKVSPKIRVSLYAVGLVTFLGSIIL